MIAYKAIYTKRFFLWLSWLLCLFPVTFMPSSFLNAQTISTPGQEYLWEQYCFDCHQCMNPTGAEPCLKSCPNPHSKETAVRATDDTGPDVVIIDQLTQLYQPVVFAHTLHADMSLMDQGCSQCHHYSNTSVIPACRDCHGLDQNPANLSQPGLKGAYHRQCMDCHIEWSHSEGCGSCHLPVGVNQPVATADEEEVEILEAGQMVQSTIIYQTNHDEAPMVSFHHQEHAQQFGVGCSDCHAGTGCAGCHDIERPRYIGISADRNKTCFSCHGEDNCAFCHRETALQASHHELPGNLQLIDLHQDFLCSDCHGEIDSFITPSCDECHGDWNVENFDHSVIGLMLNDDHIDIECEMCHMENNYTSTHNCSECHDEDVTYPEKSPGSRVL